MSGDGRPTRWTVDRTGDLLTLDGTRSAVDVRAIMVRACDGKADITATLKAGGLMWCIKGEGFELHSLVSVDRALRIAAFSSEWREMVAPAGAT